jgi:hypothetical protein
MLKTANYLGKPQLIARKFTTSIQKFGFPLQKSVFLAPFAKASARRQAATVVTDPAS